jgi:hypothetical protein
MRRPHRHEACAPAADLVAKLWAELDQVTVRLFGCDLDPDDEAELEARSDSLRSQLIALGVWGPRDALADD